VTADGCWDSERGLAWLDAGDVDQPRAETGEHPLRHLLTAAAGRDLRTADDTAAVLDWRLTALTPTDPGPLPWLPSMPATLHADPVGAATWPSDPNWSPTSPTRSKTTPAEVLARQPGVQQEVTRAQHWSAKSRYGEPPTASIPKIRDRPAEAANSIQPPPCGNSNSTGISPDPPTRQATRGLRNDKQRTPH
jgi:hypothetical protein